MHKRGLCDGCNKIKKVKSYDGRTQSCKTCQLEYLTQELEDLRKVIQEIQPLVYNR